MLSLAILLVATGIAVYVLDRGGAVYFLAGWTTVAAQASVFGALGNHLPTFLHTLIFILITAAVLRPWPRLLPAICATWIIIECLFEFGQMAPFDDYVAAIVPAWFEALPVLRITTDYFTRGTYDALDILSIVLGAAIAFPLVRMYFRGDRS